MVWNPLGESSAKGSPFVLARKCLAVAPLVTKWREYRASLPILVLMGTLYKWRVRISRSPRGAAANLLSTR